MTTEVGDSTGRPGRSGGHHEAAEGVQALLSRAVRGGDHPDVLHGRRRADRGAAHGGLAAPGPALVTVVTTETLRPASEGPAGTLMPWPTSAGGTLPIGHWLMRSKLSQRPIVVRLAINALAPAFSAVT